MVKMKTLTEADLERFTGSDYRYRHGVNQDVLITVGAMYVAETGGISWFLDEIALSQRFDKHVSAERFQVWTLQVNIENHTGMIICEGGFDEPETLYTTAIEYTDFPLSSVTLWFKNNTIFLPSEH